MLNVLDVSRYQTEIDYQQVKDSGIEGVIIRIGFTGYGIAKRMNEDPLFQQHYQGFRAVGMPVGGYYYSCATTPEEARREAEFTLSLIRDKVFEYPIYFDTEDDHDINDPTNAPESQASIGPARLTVVARTFLETLEDQNWYVGIYASTYWLNNRLYMNELREFDVWVAQYADKLTYEGPYGMWQYTDKGSVNGIAGFVDLSYACKNYPVIITNAGLNNTCQRDVMQNEPIHRAASQLYRGMPIQCRNTALYASSTASNYSRLINGTYYLWGVEVINGKVRITNTVARVGVSNQVSGWISVADAF